MSSASELKTYAVFLKTNGDPNRLDVKADLFRTVDGWHQFFHGNREVASALVRDVALIAEAESLSIPSK